MNSAVEIWRKTRPLKEQKVQELWRQVIGASVWTVKPPSIMTGLVTSDRAQRQKLHGTRSVQGTADDWSQEKRVVRFNDTVTTLEGFRQEGVRTGQNSGPHTPVCLRITWRTCANMGSLPRVSASADWGETLDLSWYTNKTKTGKR